MEFVSSVNMPAGQELAGDLRRLGLGVVRILQEIRRVHGRDVRSGAPLTATLVVKDEPASSVVMDGLPESALRATLDSKLDAEAALHDTALGDRMEHKPEPELARKPEPERAALPVARVPSNALHRAMSFASLGAKLVVGSAVDSISNRLSGMGSTDGAAKKTTNLSSHFITSKNAERLANHLSRLRGAALKLSQVLSMQDENVLPPEVQAALERVRAGADVMPAAQLEAMMRSALGDDWRDRFVSFDEQPLAAASIGQVHAASIHDEENGDDGSGGQVDVVVKVQYPGTGSPAPACPVCAAPSLDLPWSRSHSRRLHHTQVLPSRLTAISTISCGWCAWQTCCPRGCTWRMR